MADAVADAPEETAKSSKMPLIIGLVLAIAGAGGGYFAMSSGLLPFGPSAHDKAAKAGHGTDDSGDHGAKPAALPDVAFVPIEPIVVSLKSNGKKQHLRFRGQLEVNAAHADEVAAILPRVSDVLNSYLRAIHVSDLGDTLALTRARAQMLRRIQIVTGEGRVRDLLIMEFIVN